MRGKVAIEEAFEVKGMDEEIDAQAALYIAPKDVERYKRQIVSITDERLQLSDQNGIGYSILSLTVPGIQGITDKDKAEKRARDANNYIHDQIKDHRDRLGAFASLSMHDPRQAGHELRRCVKELGFHGALLNDVQHTGEGDDDQPLFYDQPDYDEFWRVAVELDVPVYLHPAAPLRDTQLYKQTYEDRKYLIGPPQSYCNGVALHLMGIIINGVFDRFPNLKVIIGHMGERIPFDFWRMDHWVKGVTRPLAEKNGDTVCQKEPLYYFKRNIYITTSGHFSTQNLRYLYEWLGDERMMFSVDFPYERMEHGCQWYDDDEEKIKEALGGRDGYLRVGRDNARRLFKLSKFKDCDVV
ncbi:2,3-dihydroxybenzoic acid decarboxylase [Aspergillus costaricaensis CBS 115574]|uniref:Amidohydrolase-related domain-containing protein n=2 Tax=Aspergillus subgen. Circumdati TaxID=2720871 RepID=A0A1L9NB88_ASPTC|nr:2,3-dihydroxybenzoic acid decarboxylase [Aspergillus costaricaensis CBS 115574]OJI86422.1 hypothetical protein ASPTUDRAFT_53641 [Aspergillus tubingensis CBS 134.48]RAK93221.1 2,3-dihydroxybenzoic acid decarboxylase [Aspergillus costaricaensis CBS 115574]